jgi:hypothetical protein
VKTIRERAAEQRVVKLENVRAEVERGSLTIRKMTDEERRLYPPRPVPVRRSRWR